MLLFRKWTAKSQFSRKSHMKQVLVASGQHRPNFNPIWPKFQSNVAEISIQCGRNVNPMWPKFQSNVAGEPKRVSHLFPRVYQYACDCLCAYECFNRCLKSNGYEHCCRLFLKVGNSIFLKYFLFDIKNNEYFFHKFTFMKI